MSTCAGGGGIVRTMDGNICWSGFSFYTVLYVLNIRFSDVYKTPRFGGANASLRVRPGDISLTPVRTLVLQSKREATFW